MPTKSIHLICFFYGVFKYCLTIKKHHYENAIRKILSVHFFFIIWRKTHCSLLENKLFKSALANKTHPKLFCIWDVFYFFECNYGTKLSSNKVTSIALFTL
jgi:hypothetical protein